MLELGQKKTGPLLLTREDFEDFEEHGQIRSAPTRLEVHVCMHVWVCLYSVAHGSFEIPCLIRLIICTYVDPAAVFMYM